MSIFRNSYGVGEPIDWHPAAAAKAREILKERGQLEELKVAVHDVEFWKGMHFGFGLGFRNLLRNNGFRETEVGVSNLDDHYMAIVALTAGYEIEGYYDVFYMGAEDIHANLKKCAS